jgi:hypothetical protein
MVTKINPVFDITLPRAFIGKSVSTLLLDIGVNASASTGPNGAIAKIIQAVQERVTVIMHSDLTGTGELMTFFIEGDFPTDTYDGTNSETFAVYMTSQIVALGTVDAILLTGAVVTAGTVYQADQTNT